VAFYFQVNAINLLNKLSVDPNLRAQYMTAATDITEEMGVRLEAIKDYQDVSEQALVRLEKQYPELKKRLEEVSGIGKDKDSLLEELINVLEDEAPDAASIVESYEKIIDDLYKEKTELNLEQAREIEEMLGRFSIYAWQYGTEFYIKEGSLQWNNIIGILITAILLSLGAPFWFERLKDVMKLKDTLAKVTNQNK
jgi:plasmid maintenance system antidote protein VapI